MSCSPVPCCLVALLLLVPGAAAGEILVSGSSIQDALAFASPGDTVVVPAGEYHENVVVTTSGIALVGRGAVIDGQFAGPCLAVTADDVTITGFRLVNGGTTSGAGPNILVYAGRGAVIDGNVLRNGAGVAMNVMGDDARITGNTVTDCVGGGIRYVASTPTSRSELSRNRVARARFGISGRRGELTVLENVLEHLDGAGLDLDPLNVFAAMHVRDNRIRNVNGIGIDVDATQGLQAYLVRNDIEDAGDAGIDVDVGGEVRVDVILNRVRRTNGDGIQIDASGPIFVSRNRVTSAAQHGIAVRATASQEARLERNVVQDVIGDGLRVQGTGFAVRQNKVARTVLAGISGTGNEGQVRQNRVRDAGRQGIRHAGDNGVLADNVVLGSGRDGLLVSGGGNVVHGNRSCSNGGDGIDLHAFGPAAGGSGNVVTGNVCLRNLHEGIDNTALGTVIDGNRAARNGGALGPDFAGAGNDLDGDGLGDGTVSSFSGNSPSTQIGKHAPGSSSTTQRLDFGEEAP